MSHADQEEETEAQALSALCDGETGASDVDHALAAYRSSAGARARWRAYATIGDTLRGLAPSAAPAPWVAAVMAEVERQPLDTSKPAVRSQPQPAANDPVWRWKMVAGVAAVTAVGALTWALLQGSPEAVVSQPQWAGNTGAPAVVNVGGMLRSPELEALLAEHRQHGGLSAVQLSSGFLRNATYDMPTQR